jgi:hypothetical protein
MLSESEASRIFKVLRRRDSSPAAQNDIGTQFVLEVLGDLMTACGLGRQVSFALLLGLGLGGVADAHTGLVDGYGCHTGPKNSGYHCHQGQFVGQTFKSKEDFLRQLRGGKEPLSPKSTPPPAERKVDK